VGDAPIIDLHVVVFGRSQPRLERALERRLRDDLVSSGAVMRVQFSHFDLQEYLHFLDVFDPNDPGSIKLGIIDEDLYSDSHGSLNFIFGEARVGGDSCVISTCRLDPRFYNIPYNERLFHDRVMKEAMHEIGHVLGLAHCDEVRCIMHFSNSIEDTDIKHLQPCDACTGRLQKNVKKRILLRVTREQGSGPGW
jgi:predicted Zn-dependent protease